MPRFKAAAQPLPFLDYLFEGFERGAIVDGGGILVNVPSPARFGLHKLLIKKDLLQAAQVLAVLVEERAGDVRVAWDEIKTRGKGWVRRVSSGLSRLKALYPDEHKKIAALLRI